MCRHGDKNFFLSKSYMIFLLLMEVGRQVVMKIVIKNTNESEIKTRW